MDLEYFPSNPEAIKMMEMITGNGFYDKSYVAKWLFQVMGLEMEDAAKLFNELRQQRFLETATWGLIYHRQKYGIVFNPELSIEEQRQQIASHKMGRFAMNPDRVKLIVEAVSGKEIDILENISPYTFMVKVIIRTGSSDFREKLLREKLNKIKPSHLSYKITTERPLNTIIYIGGLIQESELLNIRQVV